MTPEQQTFDAPFRIGIDTGGTFTDFAWFEDGQLRVYKQLSTPDDPSRAVLNGLRQAQSLPDTAAVVHGSTVATNALLERNGARTALLTTAGFRDVLAIGRQNRPDLYSLVPQKPDPLIPRQWRFEVNERVSAQGEILKQLDVRELRVILDQLRESSIESVAVCLLFSFLRPEHEQAIRRYLLEHIADLGGDDETGLHISLSSEILPEYREYERTATTVINAYVAPIMSRYLRRLTAAIRPRTVTVMQSNGGVISAGIAGEHAARTVLSGPAGGVVGGQFVARQSGYENVITLDMGGTSTDVALCPGVLPTTSEGEVAGMPLRLPILDIHTVGAGGGSLVTVDAGGALHVGPKSAGANPGPISYGLARASRQTDPGAAPEGDAAMYATTTDANLVLGRLDAQHFLGGTIRLDAAAADAALDALAKKIGAPSAQAAAWDVVRVANATMERAIRLISVERGYDPRDFTLVAFGGAGPLHACDLARALQIPRVLIPATPGVLSALGMLVAEPTRDYSQTVLRRLDSKEEAGDSWLDVSFDPLYESAVLDLEAEGYERSRLHFRPGLDLRYLGQSHELKVGYQSGTIQAVAEQFHAAHELRYGYRRPQAAVEVVNLRLTVVAPGTPLPLAPLTRVETAHSDHAQACVGKKLVWFDGSERVAELYDRSKLRPGHRFAGPAVIVQYDSTTVVPPLWRVSVDEIGNLLVEQ